jgi:hypothetical protein
MHAPEPCMRRRHACAAHCRAAPPTTPCLYTLNSCLYTLKPPAPPHLPILPALGSYQRLTSEMSRPMNSKGLPCLSWCCAARCAADSCRGTAWGMSWAVAAPGDMCMLAAGLHWQEYPCCLVAACLCQVMPTLAACNTGGARQPECRATSQPAYEHAH